MQRSVEWLDARIVALLGGGPTAELAADLLLIALIVLLFLMSWWVVNHYLRRLDGWIDDEQGTLIKSLKIQKQALFSQYQVAQLLHKAVRLLGWLLKIFLLFFFGNLAFSFFEWSRRAALGVFEFMVEVLGTMVTGFISYLPSLAIIVIVILIARFIVRVLKMIFEGIKRERIDLPGFYPEWAATSFSLARLLVIVLTIIIIFPYLPGSDSPAFQGLSIFFGVLLSLGSSSAIANIIAGVVITYTRAFNIGDRVRISATEGDVVERSAFVTRIRTPKNVEVAIPNSMVMSDHIINYSIQAREAGLLLHTTVTIGYDVPWPEVHELLQAAAARTENVLEEPAPFVLQTSLDDNYVAYELNCYTREASGKQQIYSDLHANIQDCFHAADVEILSPHYRANRGGDKLAIPEMDFTVGPAAVRRGPTEPAPPEGEGAPDDDAKPSPA